MNPDFKDIISEFLAAGVRFLVVGAHALAAHGIPRATGDIDLWVEPTQQNARRVLQALTAFGAPVSDISQDDFTREGTVFQMGVPPFRIDILTEIDGTKFEPAWQAKAEITLEGLTFPVLGRESLIKNKRASGRPKDLADLYALENQGPG